MQIKSRINTNTYLLEWLKYELTRCGETLYIGGGNAKCYSPFGKQVGISEMVMYKHTTESSNQSYGSTKQK
jgi:hypothetical protein